MDEPVQLYRKVVRREMSDPGPAMTEEDMDTLPMDDWWLTPPPTPVIHVSYEPVHLMTLTPAQRSQLARDLGIDVQQAQRAGVGLGILTPPG